MPVINPPEATPAPAPAKRPRGRPSHTVPSELYETRREEIITAARRVFAKKGYSRGSLDDVAQATGISKPTLYYYFPSKAHLFYELANQMATEQIAQLEIIAQEPDPRQCLIGLMRHQVQQVTSEMDFYRYFFDHRPALKDRQLRLALAKKLSAYSEPFYACVRRAINVGILPPMNEVIATQAIFGATFWIYKWFDSGRFTSEEVLQQFLMMIGVIKPPVNGKVLMELET